MSEIVPVVPDSPVGEVILNSPTKSNKKKQCSASKRWCFTLNNYDESDIPKIMSRCTKYVIGREKGEECGTPHLQGYVEFSSRKRPLKMFEDIHDGSIHWESARGTRADNLAYCTKDNNYETNFHIDKPLLLLKLHELYPWQSYLFSIITQDPDDRTVYWIWEQEGNTGKSAFAKLMCHTYNGLCVSGKSNDIFQGISGYKEETGSYPSMIIVDCPRHNMKFMNYGALEMVKNGHVFSGKYESKQMIFNPPHVVVFSNEEPETWKFSQDRWKVWKIVDKKIEE